MKVVVKNIKWDTDGENIPLPETLKIELPKDIQNNIEDVEEYIADEISNITGFCHYSFNYYLENY